MARAPKKTLVRCQTVGEGDDAHLMLGGNLELYADEPNVYAEIIRKRVPVAPGVTRTVEFVLLWRKR